MGYIMSRLSIYCRAIFARALYIWSLALICLLMSTPASALELISGPDQVSFSSNGDVCEISFDYEVRGTIETFMGSDLRGGEGSVENFFLDVANSDNRPLSINGVLVLVGETFAGRATLEVPTDNPNLLGFFTLRIWQNSPFSVIGQERITAGDLRAGSPAGSACSIVADRAEGNNTAPTAIISGESDRTVGVIEGNEVFTILSAFESTDPDGDFLIFSWELLSGPASQTVTPNTGDLRIFNPSTLGVQVWELTVDDRNGATDTAQATITWVSEAPPPNRIPIVFIAQDAPQRIFDVDDFSAVGDDRITAILTSPNTSDPDARPGDDPLIFEWSQIGGPTSEFITGVTDENGGTTGITIFQPSEPGRQTWQLIVRDSDGGEGRTTTDLRWNGVIDAENTSPRITLAESSLTVANIDFSDTGADRQFVLPEISIAEDPDGDPLTFEWVGLGIANDSEIIFPTPLDPTGQSAQIFQPSSERLQTYRVTVRDGRGGENSDIVAVNWLATGSNIPPVAVANASDINPRLTAPNVDPATVFIDPIGSSDADGDSLFFSWELAFGPLSDITVNPAVEGGLIIQEPAEAGQQRWVVTVDDGNGGVTTAFTTLNWLAFNNSEPTPDAGPDQTITDALVGAEITLDGSGSSDFNGSPLTYAWTQVSGPDVTLTGADTVSPSFVVPSTVSDNVDAPSEFVFALNVNDGQVDSLRPDQVTVFVSLLPPPRLVSIRRTNPAEQTTGADSLTWQFIFDQDVQNLDASDFTVEGTIAGLVIEQISAQIYNVTASGGDLSDLNGTVTVGLAAGQDISNVQNLVLSDTVPVGVNENSFTLENNLAGSNPANNVPIIRINNTISFQQVDDFTLTGDDRASVAFSAERTTDNDGDTLTFEWSQISGFPSEFLAGADNPGGDLTGVTVFQPSLPTAQTWQLVVRDGNGGQAVSVVTFQWRGAVDDPDNTRPNVFISESNHIVPDVDFSATGADRQFVLVEVTLAEDADGDPLIFEWVGFGRDNDSEIIFPSPLDPAGQSAQIFQPSNDDGARLYRLNVRDGRGGATSDDVIITWVSIGSNSPPVVVANASDLRPSISAPNVDPTTVFLDAIGSSDGDGDSLTFTWVQQLGPPSNTSVNPDVEGGLIVQQPAESGLQRWRLTVDDGSGDTRVADVFINWLNFNNSEPTANAGPDQTITNAQSGDEITLDGAGSSDLDGSPLTYVWEQVGGPTVTLIGADSVSPTFDIPPSSLSIDAPTEFIFALTVNDGQDDSEEADQITVRASPEIPLSLVSITREDPITQITNADSLTWQFTFNQSAENLDRSDFEIDGTTATLDVSETAAGIYSVTASGGDLADLDGVVTISLAAGNDIVNSAGSGLTSATPTDANEASFSLVSDVTGPTLIISDLPRSVSEPFTATFTFSEAVQGFELDDITVQNGTASDFTAVSESVYTALITATEPGTIGLQVTRNIAQDGAGNGNIATLNMSILSLEPRLFSITRAGQREITDADSLIWQLRFSPGVQNVDASDFTLEGTTATLAVTEENTAGFFSITASGGDLADLNGVVTINLAAGNDIVNGLGFALADEPIVAATPDTNQNSFTLVNDVTGPELIISGVPASTSEAFTATFTFSEAVQGFELDDVTVDNGTASDFTAVSESVYTALISPVAAGTLAISVAENIAQDGAGNSNIAAETVSTLSLAPSLVSITRADPTTETTDADSLTWQFTFDQDVQNLDASDFALEGTTATLSVTDISVSVYSVTASGGDLADLGGIVTISLAAGQDIANAAGLALTETAPTGANENSFTLENDVTAPTLIISGVPTSTSGPFTAIFIFSEAVEGFELDDIIVENGAASNLDVTAQLSAGAQSATASRAKTGSVYTALITPDGEGPLSVSVAANAVSDGAGNLLVSQPSVSTVIDTTSPSVTLSALPVDVLDVFEMTVSFSEDVNGFELSDLTLENATASDFAAVSNSIYTVLISPISAGKVSISIAENVAQDAAGNGNLAADPVSTNFIDGDVVRDRTTRIINNFVARRADQITINDPDLARRLLPNNTSARVNGSADDQRANVNFRGTLSGGDTKLGRVIGADTASKVNVWAEGTLGSISSGTSDSNLLLIHVGADFRVNENTLIGLLAQYDAVSEDQDGIDGFAVSGDGWLAGPYIVSRVNDKLIIEGRAAWGQSSNDVSPLNSFEDEFDTNRWLLKAKLTGDFKVKGWQLNPNVEVIYYEENVQDFTNTLGIDIPEQTVNLGRAAFGPRFTKKIQASETINVSPTFGVRGIWDFEQADILDVQSGINSQTEQFRARTEGGISVDFLKHGSRLSLDGFYDGIGVNDFEAYGAKLSVSFPFQ